MKESGIYSKKKLVIAPDLAAKLPGSRLFLGVLFLIMLFLLTGKAEAQQMVCQTSAFWCVVPGKAPNGYPCWCNTMYGPVSGFAIDPEPILHPSSRSSNEDEEEEITLDSAAEECLNGLGECQGKFKSTVKKNKNKRRR